MLLPSTELQLPGIRSYGTNTNGAIGLGIPSFAVSGSQLGGFYSQPFRVPEDFDRSRDARLYAFVGQGAGPGPAAGNVQLDVLRSYANVAGVPAEQTFNVVQAIPATWPTGSWLQVEIGSAAAPFIPGGTVGQFALLGIRLTRNGPAAADTWTGTLQLAANLVLRYHRLCLQPCCP